MKVSIVIPVYNVAPYLEKCLGSVTEQTYRNTEIIIVDDGSTDESFSICQTFAEKDNRIKLIHQENGGLSAARNTGMKSVTGDYVLFVDSDDWLDVTAIENLVKLAEEHEADVAACSYMRTDKEDVSADNSKAETKEYSSRDFVRLMTRPAGVFCFAWSRLIKRSLIPDNPFPAGKVFEDLMTMPQIIWKANKVVMTDAKYCYYRFRKTGISHSRFTYKAMHEMDGYISVVDFADGVHDWPTARNGIVFFLTKYHYYWFRVRANHLDKDWYRNTYKKTAHAYWKRLFRGR